MWVAAASFTYTGPTHAEPHKGPVVRVRGETHVSVQWQRELAVGGDPERAVLRLEGQALDDADRPLQSAEIALGLTAPAGEPAPPGLTHATGCGEPAVQVRQMATGLLALRSDSDGRFCVRIPLAVMRYRLHAEAEWEPARYDSVPLDQDLDFGKPPLSLWLEGASGKPDLTKASWVLAARVGFDDGGRLVHAPGLEVRWLDETGAALSSARSDAEGHLRFEVATDKLGAPGLARHRLACDGSATLGAAEVSFPVEKRARLELVLESAPAEVRAGAELPYSFRVQIARYGSTTDRRTYVPQALVQGSFVGAPVGAAETDEQGLALVPVLLAAGGQSGALEFQATAKLPFLLPSEPLRLPVEVATPRSWRSLWLLGGLLILVAWLAIGRAQPRRAARTDRTSAARSEAPRPAPRAEVRVTEEQQTPRWNGSVQDAHDRTPVAGALVRLVRPGFDGAQVLGETRTDGSGHFDLEGSARLPGDRFVVEAPLHRLLDVSAPAFGAVTITSISRRRGLLHDFARWAQNRPWASALRRKPTPLDAVIREEANAAWAARVDAVVFGAEDVDAAREASARVPDPNATRSE